MQLSKHQSQFIADAESFGYTLTLESNRFFLQKKNNKGKILRGIVFYEDGTIYRTDISLTEAINLRTQKNAREVLGDRNESNT